MSSIKWVPEIVATPPALKGTAGDRALLRGLIWSAILRARNEDEADAAEALQAILDTMDMAEAMPAGIDLFSACYRA